MAGYIGKAQSVSLTSGYTTDQADAEFVNDPNEVITVSGSNVGIGTSSPIRNLHIDSSVAEIALSSSVNSTGFINVCDSTGNNGTNSSLTVRGLVSNGTAGSNLEVINLAADRVSVSGYINSQQPFVSARWDTSSISSGRYTGYSTSSGGLPSGGHYFQYLNSDGMLNTSTGVVTVPLSGKYLLAGSYASDDASTSRKIGHLYVNDVYWGEWGESDSSYADITITRIIDLTANDFIKFGHNTSFSFDGFGFQLWFLG